MNLWRALLVFLFFLGSLPSIIAQELPYDSREYVEWANHQRLSWEMFKGKPEEHSFGDAATAVKIQAHPNMMARKPDYQVYALFSMEKSWCKERSDELLAHEQLHFDIAELTARQVRREVELLKMSNIYDPAVYTERIQNVLNQSNLYDALYDQETLHGILKEKQKEWEDKINVELNLLKDYSVQKEVRQ